MRTLAFLLTLAFMTVTSAALAEQKRSQLDIWTEQAEARTLNACIEKKGATVTVCLKELANLHAEVTEAFMRTNQYMGHPKINPKGINVEYNFCFKFEPDFQEAANCLRRLSARAKAATEGMTLLKQ